MRATSARDFYPDEMLAESVSDPMTTSNAYCAALGINPPRIEEARSSPDANYYGPRLAR